MLLLHDFLAPRSLLPCIIYHHLLPLAKYYLLPVESTRRGVPEADNRSILRPFAGR